MGCRDIFIMEITREIVKTNFDYKDGLLIWKVKFCSKIRIGEVAGCIANHKGILRRHIRINGTLYLASRLIFLWHHGWLPEIVDHKDRNPINDRIENLRAANHTQNSVNCSSKKNSSSKYLGVNFKNGKYWQANIRINGKKTYLGYFKTEEDAALAYNEAAKIHHGEFANLNII